MESYRTLQTPVDIEPVPDGATDWFRLAPGGKYIVPHLPEEDLAVLGVFDIEQADANVKSVLSQYPGRRAPIPFGGSGARQLGLGAVFILPDTIHHFTQWNRDGYDINYEHVGPVWPAGPVTEHMWLEALLSFYDTSMPEKGLDGLLPGRATFDLVCQFILEHLNDDEEKDPEHAVILDMSRCQAELHAFIEALRS